jgi:hypothetical protein
MSQMVHSRHFDRAPLTSGRPRLADILWVIRDVSKVPEPEVSIPLSSFHGPSYEGFDRCQLRMAGPVHDVEGATRHRHVR